MSPIYVNTEERLTHEDVASYLQRCQQSRMALEVMQWRDDARDLGRRYHDLLLEVARLRQQINQKPEPGRPVSYKSQWD